MQKISFIFIIFFLLNNLGVRSTAEEIQNLKKINPSNNLIWIFNESLIDNKNLIWFKTDQNLEFESTIQNIYNPPNYEVKSVGKAISINDIFYPDISNYVPNGFVETPWKTFTASARGISKTRHCRNNCKDGVLDIDFNLINLENFSINPKINIQSLTNRGTKAGEGVSLGFKAAKKLSSNWSLAIGGENIVHLDDTIDLGRNFYIVASTFAPLSQKGEKNIPSMIFINAGVGSDFYGYKGNGFLGTTSCFGKPTLTGKGTNKCNWGPIGSVALVFNENFSIINEWFGYGYGSGFSYKPFKNKSLVFSFFATDFIKDFPSYIKEGCPDNDCSTRFYGSLSLTL